MNANKGTRVSEHEPFGLVVSGGRTRRAQLLREASRASMVVAADSGILALNRAGLSPDALVGDFDSVDPVVVANAKKAGVMVLSFPVDKDKTDTEIALDFLVERGFEVAHVLGALGGRRTDHELANIFLMEKFLREGLRVTIIDPVMWLTVIGGERSQWHTVRIPASVGDWVSLFPLTEVVTGVSSTDLMFPLRGDTLRRGSTLPVSNRVSGPNPEVRIVAGNLLVVATKNTHRRARHARGETPEN